MNDKQKQLEQISALIDAELSDQELDAALAQLADAESQADWALYQQIGDVLRSDDLAYEFSADFNQKLMQRLAEEPTVLAPSARTPNRGRLAHLLWGSGGFAVAAMLSWLFLPALQHQPAAPAGAEQLALSGSTKSAQSPASITRASSQLNSATVKNTADAERAVEDLQVLRDPKLDSYLMAHQRYSPSLNQSGVYVSRTNVVNATSDK